LEGWKTQTRRVMKPQPFDDGGIWRWQHGRHVVAVPGPRAFGLEEWAIWQECPYQVGQTLWVRETWADGIAGCPNGVSYRADHLDPLGDGPANPMKWRPSIHMPRWASRITLTITDVRVQRVQDISEEDAEEEGVVNCGNYWQPGEGFNCPCSFAYGAFSKLWDSINAKRGYSWDANPWVWALSFRREI
jgi:hypothetical protein